MFESPSDDCFTIYTKSGCVNCNKIKKLLDESKIKYNKIECDEYLIENKEVFLDFIAVLANKKITFFPIIFDKGSIVGGFNETVQYVDKILSFTDL